ncbi:hypothetical protein COU88_03490 [Candidatus Roizmanbacteria bacterium CG10_big_fil_rev_8_21_14_0_10_39_6]|uniref:Uncharacterized protein n=1 Tax=Candidatus Roizmanbacteria bacterium CG10_big_fil_rev_8_21_14_0_10_39_6 TaxID=1974853 RepID=A0A2M8KS14_9BACT|nr:MAG: hypothetical protein COU88_03490 [Candidatus Roizmanbacteria bacterium CG10_big_fil_rev_8_21_14_0_10_39_6]
MSELRSVLVFFFGLLFFVLLVAFALGRVKLPKSIATSFKNLTKKVKLSPTPTLTGTVTPTSSFLTSTPTPIFVGSTSVPVGNTVQGVNTIPETGSPTLFLAVPFLVSGAGFWLKKRS